MHHNVWEFTGLCWWSMVEQYAMTSKTHLEKVSPLTKYSPLTKSLFYFLLSVYFQYTIRFLGINYYQPLKHCTIIIIKYFKGFDLAELYRSSTKNSKLKTFNHDLRTFLYVFKCTSEFPKAKSRQFSLYCCWLSRPFPFTVDVSFVCLLLGTIFVRGSVVL